MLEQLPHDLSRAAGVGDREQQVERAPPHRHVGVAQRGRGGAAVRGDERRGVGDRREARQRLEREVARVGLLLV